MNSLVTIYAASRRKFPIEINIFYYFQTTTLTSKYACFKKSPPPPSKVKCVSYGKCGCKLDNGKGFIDLSSMISAAGRSQM